MILRNILSKYRNGLCIGVGASLGLAYDSYKFRKETSPDKNNYIIKPSEIFSTDAPVERYTHNIYSRIMWPFRLIKDHFWINDIHRKLIKGVDGNIIRESNYKNFLEDFPYSDDVTYRVLYDYTIKPADSWIAVQLINRGLTHNDYNKQTNDNVYYKMIEYLKTNYKKEYDVKLAQELLRVELYYKSASDIEKNSDILDWCFYQSTTFNKSILDVLDDLPYEIINKIPDNLKTKIFDAEYLDRFGLYHMKK